MNQYDLDPHVAEIYDQVETETDDIELIRTLITGKGVLRILEPFCGTGRILIPLALDGQEIVGLDAHGFAVERTFGDRAGTSYLDASPRAIFWARKR